VRCAVVGVLPPGFCLGGNARIYLPIEQCNGVELRTRENHPGLRVIGRLKPGVTIETVQADIASICDALSHQYPKSNAGHGAKLVRMKDDMVGYIRPTLPLLAGAVGFVLIIACANVANLLLARSTARKREFAIRTALGAERGRVVRQLLTDSVLLSLGGAMIGLLLARWGTRLVLAAAPGSLPRSAEIGIHPYVLLFTLAVSVVTGVLFGLAPAQSTRRGFNIGITLPLSLGCLGSYSPISPPPGSRIFVMEPQRGSDRCFLSDRDGWPIPADKLKG